jgi:hypothetical protein
MDLKNTKTFLKLLLVAAGYSVTATRRYVVTLASAEARSVESSHSLNLFCLLP